MHVIGNRAYAQDRIPWVGLWHNDKRTPLEHPYSYSDHYLWGSDQTARGCSGAYSDRFQLWATAEHLDAAMRAGGLNQGDYSWRTWDAAAATRFLNAFWPKRKYLATALAEGCNVGNGYPYWIVFYKEVDAEA